MRRSVEPIERATDRLWTKWRRAEGLARRFAARPLEDPVRQKWAAEAARAWAELEAEERRLIDPDAKL